MFLHALPPKGILHYELLRGGRVIVPRTEVLNSVMNTAKNQLLNAWFNAAGGTTSGWCVSLVDGATFVSFPASDTISSHLNWVEFTNYTVAGNGVFRAAWGQGTASGQAVTNAAPAVFDFAGFTGTKTVQGIFVVSDVTKGGTTGLLWSTAAFSAPLTVAAGDQLRATYTVQL